LVAEQKPGEDSRKKGRRKTDKKRNKGIEEITGGQEEVGKDKQPNN